MYVFIMKATLFTFYLFVALGGSEAAKIACSPTAIAELCPSTTLFCTCAGTGTAVRWTTNKTGVFEPPTGVTFSADLDNVGDSHTEGGLNVVLVNKTMSNFISTLQVNAADVAGVQVSCSIGGVTDTITPQLAAAPVSPKLMNVPSTSCDPMSGNQVTLQWTPPIDTGGQSVDIDHYMVNDTGPAGVTCSPEPCNMISGTITFLTGLLCNANYTVTVRAVNCIGQGPPSLPVIITRSSEIDITIACLVESNSSIRVEWILPVTTSCYSITGYTLSVLNNMSESVGLTTNIAQTKFSSLVSISNTSTSYTIILTATTNCGMPSSDTMMITASDICVEISPQPLPSPTSPTNSTTNTTTTPASTAPSSLGPIAGGAFGAAAAVAAAVIVTACILTCVYCPCCGCCMWCRSTCCRCCPEEYIRFGPYRYSHDSSMLAPHDKKGQKQPVLKNYSKEMETGQPSSPEPSGMSAGAMYQDPNTIQRQAAPTNGDLGMSAGAMYRDPNTIQRQAAPTSGDLYAEPDKPARHQQKQQAMELPTYQDPSTIQRQAYPTGDMYALPDKIPKQPSGPVPALYTEVDKTNQTGTMYAELDHTGIPVPTRRPPPQRPQPVYSDVRDTHT